MSIRQIIYVVFVISFCVANISARNEILIREGKLNLLEKTGKLKKKSRCRIKQKLGDFRRKCQLRIHRNS